MPSSRSQLQNSTTITITRLKVCLALFCMAVLHQPVNAEGDSGPSPNTSGLKLRAVFSQSGVWGTITFQQGSNDKSVHIKANLSVSTDKAGDYSWGVYEFPIDYSRSDTCNSKKIGKKPLINFDGKLNKLSLVKEEETVEVTEEQDTTLEPVTGEPEGMIQFMSKEGLR